MGDTSGRVHLIGVAQDDDGIERWEELVSWQAHSGPVAAIDWSLDRMAGDLLLRTCSTSSMELAFCKKLRRLQQCRLIYKEVVISVGRSENGGRISTLWDIRNMRWASHHCPLLYDVAGQ
jgi:hypothetical protein